MARPGFARSVFGPSTGRLHERWCYILQGVPGARAVPGLAFAFIREVDLLCARHRASLIWKRAIAQAQRPSKAVRINGAMQGELLFQDGRGVIRCEKCKQCE